MKKVKGVNDDECRNIAKSYLACRMDRSAVFPTRLFAAPYPLETDLPLPRNLMAKDDFKNLGFKEVSGDRNAMDADKAQPGEVKW